jgi:23S rRNA (cytosine1962-C5)-methyltransferase
LPVYIRVKLRPKEEDRLLAGHPWVFANEIEKATNLSQGTLVEVMTSKGQPVGRGIANPSSKIIIRLLTRDFSTEVDEALIRRRVEEAVALRRPLLTSGETDGARLLFGEGDGLPGLIVDAFGKTAVLSCFSAGLKPYLPVVTETLVKQGFLFVYEKSVGETCQKEGMPEFQGWLTEPGEFPLTFKEGTATFKLRPDQGQKTGFYLDFREGRRRLSSLAKGKRILDAFCYTGAASIQAALGGAREVVGLESSQQAVEEALENARANGVEGKTRFEKADSFKDLRELRKSGENFDGILLDPPPLAKSVHEIPEGRQALKRLVSLSLGILNPKGFLIVATCSHHFPWNVLEAALNESIAESGRSFRLQERLTQPSDHPIILSVPETEYLRTVVLTESAF